MQLMLCSSDIGCWKPSLQLRLPHVNRGGVPCCSPRGSPTPAPACPADTYLRTIVPISALYAGTLWLGNAAYLYLSVSFIQMLKVGAAVRRRVLVLVAVVRLRQLAWCLRAILLSASFIQLL